MTTTEDSSDPEIKSARLARIPILQGLDELVLRQLASLFVIEDFPEDRVIIQQGEPGDKLYLIVSGSVEVLVALPTGEQNRVAVLQDGAVIGEIALLRNVPRTATVRTLAASTFLTLTRDHFNGFLEGAPDLRARFEEMAASRS